ncbi:hypothetical protein GCM10022225_37260 [Plantactinospora mayteni]|uniref:Secreted protein n=1 Tax=Plantactinospora mayteni TaxID=566021 RepID=A0ABQ4EKR4_9ACTN|nr:hypothetical protein [Plantactinospora mayteni]GIG95306.1 hypothetical protein Pma05_18790 [Plantactinospora mayteni]
MRLKRWRAYVVATMVATLSVVVGLQAPAAAEEHTIYVTGGYGVFNDDPYGPWPGDAIRACDTYSDGWGIEVRMDISNNGSWDLIISTRGHNAIYCTDYHSKNAVENDFIRIRVTPVRGDERGQWTEAIRRA